MGGGSYRLETIRKPKTKIFIFLLIITLIISIIYINRSQSRYVVSKIYEDIVTGTVKNNKTNGDLNIIAIYQEDENGEYAPVDDVPQKGYTLVVDKKEEKHSSCTINGVEDNNITFQYKSGYLFVNYISKKGTKCNFYFKKVSISDIYADAKKGAETFDKTSCNNEVALANTKNSSNKYECGENTSGIYSQVTNEGTTYYFRGSVNNNWVKFANLWWRIIRINEDNTVRLIYAGKESNYTQENDNEITRGYFMGYNSGIGSLEFNAAIDYNARVGYMYGKPNSTTFENEHGYDLIDNNQQSQLTSSNAKTELDNWYKSNLSEFSTYLSGSTGFCGDRSISSEYPNGYTTYGYGWQKTVYGALGRLSDATNTDFYGTGTSSPTYECKDKKHDLYTTKSEPGEGNGALDYPIGLITADEVVYAGGFRWDFNTKPYNFNYGYWLWTGYDYWTMSPFCFDGVAREFSVGPDGRLDNLAVQNTRNFKPVINLKPEYLITDGHDGTIDNPYIVQ